MTVAWKHIVVMACSLASLPVAAASYSGTLPVMFIETADAAPVVSKETYIDATYYIDAMGVKDFSSVGTRERPLTMQIRGRGNWSWTGFDKKPYRIRLGASQRLLGMKKNRHFALLAEADDNSGFMRNLTAFELSRLMGLDYTPAMEPIELVLNGDYVGLYILTETIRVEPDRLDIVEQKAGETDPKKISGGWLVELDNYRADNQLRLSTVGKRLGTFWITYHSPDSLSEEQEAYLRDQMERLLDTVYADDKSSTDWEELIDIHSLARYYVISEVLDHVEAFMGSCYMHKDLYEQQWKLGPVWDFGHAFNSFHDKQTFSYIFTNGWRPCIMEELAKFPRLQDEILRVWNGFYPVRYEHILQLMGQWTDYIREAARCNYERWPDLGNKDMDARLAASTRRLNEKVEWLRTLWGDGDPSGDYYDVLSEQLYDLNGKQLSRVPPYGFYLRKIWTTDGRTLVVKQMQR